MAAGGCLGGRPRRLPCVESAGKGGVVVGGVSPLRKFKSPAAGKITLLPNFLNGKGHVCVDTCL